MGYLGLNPNLKAYKSSVYIATAGDIELPLTIDVECLVIKNGVILTPELDFYRNPNTNKVNLFTPAEQGDEFYLINLSTFAFSGLVTKDELEKKINEVQSPLFTVMWFPSRESITGGFVPADGQTLSRSLYMDAFAGIESALVPVVADADWLSTPSKRASYTTGDGSTTFRMPDYNGKSPGGSAAVVLRGDGLNTDPAGSIQGDAIREIHGDLGWVMGGNRIDQASGALAVKEIGSDYIPPSPGGSSAYRILDFKASRVVPTAPENRMVNTAGVWCIRLFSSVVFAGRANAAQLATEVGKLNSETSQLRSDVDSKSQVTLFTGKLAHNQIVNIPTLRDFERITVVGKTFHSNGLWHTFSTTVPVVSIVDNDRHMIGGYYGAAADCVNIWVDFLFPTRVRCLQGQHSPNWSDIHISNIYGYR